MALSDKTATELQQSLARFQVADESLGRASRHSAKPLAKEYLRARADHAATIERAEREMNDE